MNNKLGEDNEFRRICLAYIIDRESGEPTLATPKPEELTHDDWILLQQGTDNVKTSMGDYALRSSRSEVEDNPGRGFPLVKYVTYEKFSEIERQRPCIEPNIGFIRDQI
tara:strand:- start:1532 stop:1858 length:327 start_codon:yes stop_codon:yes gene_type:complete